MTELFGFLGVAGALNADKLLQTCCHLMNSKKPTGKKFIGPIFLVGLSRSGTQLLRELLNRNPHICIPVRESHFIPRVLSRDGGTGNKPTLRSVRIVEQSNFIADLRGLGLAPDKSRVAELAATLPVEMFFEQLFRECVADQKNNDCIWGDKTPLHMLHMPLLKSAYPSARFIHIVRDPREVALSAFNSWGAHPLVTAQKWRKHMLVVEKDRDVIGPDYLDVKFEELVSNPESVLQEICEFLDTEFNNDMLSLSKPADEALLTPTERSSSRQIIKNNVSKYLEDFDQENIRRIDQLLYPVAESWGYAPISNVNGYKPLGIGEKCVANIVDRTLKLAYFVRRWGVVNGLRYACGRFANQVRMK